MNQNESQKLPKFSIFSIHQPVHHAGTGLNYAAILDTALDIAKAMLHLHAADILHGDLKVGAVQCMAQHFRFWSLCSEHLV